jgi:hypothetical protein
MIKFLREARFNDEFAYNSNLALVSREDFELIWSKS